MIALGEKYHVSCLAALDHWISIHPCYSKTAGTPTRVLPNVQDDMFWDKQPMSVLLDPTDWGWTLHLYLEGWSSYKNPGFF